MPSGPKCELATRTGTRRIAAHHSRNARSLEHSYGKFPAPTAPPPCRRAPCRVDGNAPLRHCATTLSRSRRYSPASRRSADVIAPLRHRPYRPHGASAITPAPCRRLLLASELVPCRSQNATPPLRVAISTAPCRHVLLASEPPPCRRLLLASKPPSCPRRTRAAPPLRAAPFRSHGTTRHRAAAMSKPPCNPAPRHGRAPRGTVPQRHPGTAPQSPLSQPLSRNPLPPKPPPTGRFQSNNEPLLQASLRPVLSGA
jgi:hypothetical protein